MTDVSTAGVVVIFRAKMVVFMPLTVVWMGQFCRNVIGHQNVKVAVICVGCYVLLHSIRLLVVDVCQFRLRSCMSRL